MEDSVEPDTDVHSAHRRTLGLHGRQPSSSNLRDYSLRLLVRQLCVNYN